MEKVLDMTESTGGGADIWDAHREAEDAQHYNRQRYVEMGDVMVWRMPGFNIDINDVDHLFGIANKHKALVLDLRGNPGGAIMTLKRMLGNVFDHDVKIADRVERKEMKPNTAQSSGSSAHSGKLIVPVDSSAPRLPAPNCSLALCSLKNVERCSAITRRGML
jgi:C-terminal processing protease CtpA/Prc